MSPWAAIAKYHAPMSEHGPSEFRHSADDGNLTPFLVHLLGGSTLSESQACDSERVEPPSRCTRKGVRLPSSAECLNSEGPCSLMGAWYLAIAAHGDTPLPFVEGVFHEAFSYF